jgi:hypothetical protein
MFVAGRDFGDLTGGFRRDEFGLTASRLQHSISASVRRDHAIDVQLSVRVAPPQSDTANFIARYKTHA